MTRPSWDKYFMKIAQEVATRSTCLRRHVGCVLVMDKRILATGYNGVPSGIEHCEIRGCVREEKNIPSGERHELCRGLHAEMNALLQGARYGIKVDGASLYSTTFPCSMCAKMLINAGIRQVVCSSDYPDELSKEMLQEAGIEIVVIEPVD